MNKLQKYIDQQDRTLHFKDGNTSYMITSVPGPGNSFTYGLYAWYEGQRDNAYFDKAEDVAWAMKEISGDLRKWHVCPTS